MFRLLLLLVLVVIVGRAFWRLFDGIVDGARGGPSSSRVPERSVAMVRDPVCGTFVVPARALSLGDGSARTYFCSSRCRDAFRDSHQARPA